MFENLCINIFSNFIASGFWKTIDYFVENYKERIEELLLDIFNMLLKRFQSDIYHGNTPLTYTGNGKFGDHL
jgi:hypothetical protein